MKSREMEDDFSSGELHDRVLRQYKPTRRRAMIAPMLWNGAPVLAAARALNAAFIAKVVEIATAATSARGTSAFIERRLGLWRALDGRAQERMAQTPVLLLNARFEDEALWTGPPDGATVRSVTTVTRGADQQQLKVAPDREEFLSPEDSRSMLADVLKAAAIGAKHEVSAVRIHFGTSIGLAQRSGSLSLWEIDLLSTRYAHLLRPRFEDRLQFWDGLMAASQGKSGRNLAHFHAFAVRLLAGTLM
jgi:hypothetical protein